MGFRVDEVYFLLDYGSASLSIPLLTFSDKVVVSKRREPITQ